MHFHKVNQPAEDPIRDEPEKTHEPSYPDVDNIPDGPSLPDQVSEAEHMDIDSTAHVDDPPSPAKHADDDVVITGMGYTSLVILSLYQSIVPRKNFLRWTRASGKQICQAMPTSTPKTFVLDF